MVARTESNHVADKIGKAATTDEAIDQRLDEPRKKWSDLTDQTLKDAPRSMVTAMREIGRQLFSMEKFDEELLHKQLRKISIRADEQAALQQELSNLRRKLKHELGLDVQMNIAPNGRIRQLEIGVAPPETTRTKLKFDVESRRMTALSEHFSMRAPGSGLVLSTELPVSVALEQLQSKSVWHRQSAHADKIEKSKVNVEARKQDAEDRNDNSQTSLQNVDRQLPEIDKPFEKFELALNATSRNKVKVEELRSQAESIRKELSKAEQEIADGKRTTHSLPEKAQRSRMELLLKQVDSITMVRYLYAVALNEHGHRHNDPEAKAKAIAVLKSIQDVDPETFKRSSEVQGAIVQAEAGRKITPLAFNTAAETTPQLRSGKQ